MRNPSGNAHIMALKYPPRFSAKDIVVHWIKLLFLILLKKALTTLAGGGKMALCTNGIFLTNVALYASMVIPSGGSKVGSLSNGLSFKGVVSNTHTARMKRIPPIIKMFLCIGGISFLNLNNPFSDIF